MRTTLILCQEPHVSSARRVEGRGSTYELLHKRYLLTDC